MNITKILNSSCIIISIIFAIISSILILSICIIYHKKVVKRKKLVKNISLNKIAHEFSDHNFETVHFE